MINLGKRNILGVGVTATDYEGAVQAIVQAGHQGKRCTVTALAVHGVMTGVFDPEHRYRLNQLDVVCPDGQPVRWALNMLYRVPLTERVYGPNLMLFTCQAAAKEGLPIFLFGGDQTMLDGLAKRLTERFPDLKIAGTQPSKFRRVSEEEGAELVQKIKGSGAKIAFVGIGCPRQEVWAYEFGDQLQMPILAVGAAFAFHSGQLSQAPAWLQKAGLEWLFRFACEPVRLWRRYVLLNPAYVSLLTLQMLRLKRFELADSSEPKQRLLYG
jgi:exopolysaccharide biosynthesis WecB/TagA/CpsF family protein